MMVSDEDGRITAYHEGVHTLVGKLLPGLDPIHKVSIIPRGMALGVTQTLPKEDMLNLTKSKALNMIAFLFGGEMILNALGVNIKAFAVAGSLIIFAIAAEMIFGVQLFRSDASSAKIVSVVPIAFPLIAGAGTMTTLVSLRAEYAAINISIAVFLNVIVVYLVLRITKKLEEILGAGGIAIIKKVFGIILLAIAVKLFADNAKALFTM